MLKKYKILLLVLLPLLWLAGTSLVFAQQVPQEKSMSNRGAVDEKYIINADGTVTSQSTETIHYVGSYHRTIMNFSRHDQGNLSNIKIWDLTDNIEYQQVPAPLDALDPNSWGKFAVYQQGDTQYFEWYYHAQDEDKQWKIQYDLSGLLTPYYDKLLLNVGNTVGFPISNLHITVSAPVILSLLDESRSSGQPITTKSITPDTKNPLLSDAYSFDLSNLQQNESYNISVTVAKDSVKLNPLPALAAGKTDFTQISDTLQINPDSSVNVIETLSPVFTGDISSLNRVINLSPNAQIFNISLSDTGTNANFTQTDSGQTPNTFTAVPFGQAENITWYFASSTAANYLLTYKISGAVALGQTTDTLNLKPFSGLPGSAAVAQITVNFPSALSVPADSLVTISRTGGGSVTRTSESPTGISFSLPWLSYDEGVSLTVTLPKTQVSQTALLKQSFIQIYGVALSLAVIILTLLVCFIFWLVTQKLPKGRGVVVAEYQPPQNLPPAIAEIVCKEKLTFRGLAATIVDLAQRGYLKIEPDKNVILWLPVLGRVLVILASIFFLFIVALVPAVSGYNSFALITSAIFALLGILAFWSLVELFTAKEFKLTKLKPAEQGDSRLEPYEYLLLCALFGGGPFAFSRDVFSTGQEKKWGSASDLLDNLNSVKNSLYEKANLQTQAFAVDLYREATGRKRFWGLIGSVFYIGIRVVVTLAKSNVTSAVPVQAMLLGIVTVMCVLAAFGYIAFQARLNKQGRILKEEWQGFALFLTKTEKFNNADLSSNVLEPYLPYAIVFGAKNQFAATFGEMMSRLRPLNRRGH